MNSPLSLDHNACSLTKLGTLLLSSSLELT
jgi:hypothetical protein